MTNDYAKMHIAANKVPTTCHTPAILFNVLWQGQVIHRNVPRGQAYALKAIMRKGNYKMGNIEIKPV